MTGFLVARERLDGRRDRVSRRGYPDLFGHRIRIRRSSWSMGYQRWLGLADFSCAAIGTFAAVELRFGREVTAAYITLSLALPVFWLGAVWFAGGYDVRFSGAGTQEFQKIVVAGMGLTALIAFSSYALNMEMSRAYVAIALPSVTLTNLLARFGMRKWLHRLRSAGQCLLSVVVVGPPLAAAALVAELRRDKSHGLRVVAVCLEPWAPGAGLPGAGVPGVPVAGGFDDVVTVVRRFQADTVAVLSWPDLDGIRLRSLAWRLAETGAELCVTPPLLDVSRGRTTVLQTAGLTLLHVNHPNLRGPRLLLKGFFDRAAAMAALVVLAPVLGLLAAAIWLGDGGPPLFSQIRVGKDGRSFRIYKFRTMVVDAERRRAALAAQNEADGVLFKLRRDPRVTGIGWYLRRWSLDELPQLFNVFRGEMSLVGPRPALPEETARYAAHVRRRLVVKPGVTGLWQVNGRSDLSWEDSVRLDLRYVENWSFSLDLQIIWKTASAMLRGSGAY